MRPTFSPQQPLRIYANNALVRPCTFLQMRRKELSSASLLIILASLLFLSFAAEAKNVACVAARGRMSSYKIESKCVNVKAGEEIRTYRIYTAKAPQKNPQALILVLHGGGGSGSAMEAMTQGQFNRIADKYGVIVVYPDGQGRSWNDGRSDLQAKAARADIDDVAFLRKVVKDVGEKNSIDPKRIYATGISNGGLMSFRLACDASDWIAAVAPVAANLSAELAAECRPMRVMPVAIFNGTDDPIMPW